MFCVNYLNLKTEQISEWNIYLSLLLLLGSDMELDLLAAAETESDSESNHSNQDNASGRRSVVTAATAGSEAGWSTAGFNLSV